MINKEILLTLYENKNPTTFSPPNSVKLISLDKTSYLENKLINSNSASEINEYFSIKNLPEKQTQNFKLEVINSPSSKPVICFTINKNCDFFVIREHKKEEEIIFSSSENKENFIKFIDKTATSSEIYTYKVKFCDKLKNEEFFSNEIKLKVY